ncbi:MAG: hypothetical protein ACI8UO_001336 [Verrucomicrobiales bacterium]|jgi:hypothetical protein
MKIIPGFLKNRPKLRKFCFFCFGSFLVMALALSIFLIWAGREDEKYGGYLKSGANINTFLKAYGKEVIAAVDSGNVDKLLDYYAHDYSSPGRGQWTLGEETEVNGVFHSYIQKVGDEDYDREKLKEELQAYVSGLKSVKQIACKINLAEDIQPFETARATVKFVLDGEDRDGRVLQDRFFYRWWFRAVEGEQKWEIVKGELFLDDEVDNTRVASVQPGFELLDLEKAGISYVHKRDPNLDPEAPGVVLKFAVIQHAGGGLATSDYDGDGLIDLFFLDGVSSRLLRNTGNDSSGTPKFEDVTAAAGLEGIDRAHSALFADFDNDGDKDLFVARYLAPNQLFVNQGDGVFVDKAKEMNMDFNGESISSTLLDYDRDGFVDVYLAVNGDSINEVPRIPFYARNGQPNRLFRNVGGKKFEDVTEKAGVGDTGWSLATCAGDLDGDGWTDIGVANDFGRKSIFHNNGDGTFTEIAKEAGTLDFSGGMGIVFGDLNSDGLIDIYTSNIYSNQRWLGESVALDYYVRNTLRSKWMIKDFGEFWDLYGVTQGDWRALGKMAGEGNSLFLNRGDGTFREARESCTNRAGWGWSVALFDPDNDADTDIYAANGWITGKIPDDL